MSLDHWWQTIILGVLFGFGFAIGSAIAGTIIRRMQKT